MRTETSDIELLIGQLVSADGVDRENAAYLLGEIGAEALALASNTLKNRKDIEQRNALAKPAVFERAVEALIVATSDKVAWVRGNAAEALGKLKAQNAVNALIRCLSDKEQVVVTSAVESLGTIGDFTVTERLTKLLGAEEWSIRMQAARSLGQLRNPETNDALTLALNDDRADVRIAAQEALDQLSEDGVYENSPLRA